MLTCYTCGKTIKGPLKQTGIVSAARMTGWDYKTNKPRNLDFAKAYHQPCYDAAEKQAIAFLHASISK